MSEHQSAEHSSFIKTPGQLIAVVVISFVVPVAVIVALAWFVSTDSRLSPDHPIFSEEAVARRIKPVGDVVVVDASAPKAARSGKEIHDTVCAACHTTGALNAPKLGDKAAWAKLNPQGLDQLTANAIKGIRNMPARGGNPALTDAEVGRAVAYLANQSGANFKEPADPPAKPAEAAAAGTPVAAAPEATPAPTTQTADASAVGKKVYDSSCMACHTAGVAGAPRLGDKAGWAPRLKTGTDALYAASIKGKNAMPPKGGNMALSDADVKAAVDYMLRSVR